MKIIACAVMAGTLVASTSAEAHRHHHYRHHHHASSYRHRHVVRERGYASEATILHHPSGCPRSDFCGCGAAIEIFGRPIRDLWLAANWFAFPRAAPGYHMAAVRRHHVMVIREYLGNGMARVFDANSGHHMTREHVVSLVGYTIVNPLGGRYAERHERRVHHHAIVARPAFGDRTVRASFYSHGQLTASGERFNPHDMTAASPSLPFGTRVRVTYRTRTVVVRINDRGPFKGGRKLDLSHEAARRLGMLDIGVAAVQVRVED